MNQVNLCEEFSSGLSSLFTCTPHGEYQRIRTPYLYPDGDNIDIFIKKDGDIFIASDLGETTRWLRMQTISKKRSPKQQTLIEDACQTHGIEFFRGMLIVRCRKEDSLSSIVFRLTQTALRVSDLWFTMRTRSVESVNDEVADFLSEHQFQFKRSEKLIGRSGRTWMPDFHIRTIHQSSLLYVLSTGSRSAARSVVYQVHTAFFDLNHLASGPEALNFISLFDDTLDIWSDEDFRLVEQVSEVARWSNPDEFTALLTDAA